MNNERLAQEQLHVEIEEFKTEIERVVQISIATEKPPEANLHIIPTLFEMSLALDLPTEKLLAKVYTATEKCEYAVANHSGLYLNGMMDGLEKFLPVIAKYDVKIALELFSRIDMVKMNTGGIMVGFRTFLENYIQTALEQNDYQAIIDLYRQIPALRYTHAEIYAIKSFIFHFIAAGRYVDVSEMLTSFKMQIEQVVIPLDTDLVQIRQFEHIIPSERKKWKLKEDSLDECLTNAEGFLTVDEKDLVRKWLLRADQWLDTTLLYTWDDVYAHTKEYKDNKPVRENEYSPLDVTKLIHFLTAAIELHFALGEPTDLQKANAFMVHLASILDRYIYGDISKSYNRELKRLSELKAQLSGNSANYRAFRDAGIAIIKLSASIPLNLASMYRDIGLCFAKLARLPYMHTLRVNQNGKALQYPDDIEINIEEGYTRDWSRISQYSVLQILEDISFAVDRPENIGLLKDHFDCIASAMLRAYVNTRYAHQDKLQSVTFEEVDKENILSADIQNGILSEMLLKVGREKIFLDFISKDAKLLQRESFSEISLMQIGLLHQNPDELLDIGKIIKTGYEYQVCFTHNSNPNPIWLKEFCSYLRALKHIVEN